KRKTGEIKVKKYESDIIVHKSKSNIEFIQFKKLLEYKEIEHAFFLRHGGKSKDIYSTLNFRVRGKDKAENVYENLNKICNVLNLERKKVVKGLQAHTDRNICIDINNYKEYIFEKNSEEEFDGMITNEKKIPLIITTADCTPIIFLDPVNKCIANVHSGWKGTVKQIYLKTCKLMNEKYNTNYKDIICCIGPCIRKCCWTTKDRDLIENQILSIWPNEKKYIQKVDEIYHVDFINCIKEDLIKLGLKSENILDANICTCCNNEDFFSFRKTTMKEEKDYGTQASIVQINI
ncbi:MAG: peptidoglycan editing factor PgeF, partial [Clostridia bacterium]